MNKIIKSEERFAFIPGPKHLNYVIDSQSVEEFEHYSAKEFMEYVESIKNAHFVGDKNYPKDCKLQIKSTEGNNLIEMDITLDLEETFWLGSNLVLNCTVEDMLNFWHSLLERFPAIYLHDTVNLNVYPIECIQEVEF